jgi:anti-sigma B factor antagonist
MRAPAPGGVRVAGAPSASAPLEYRLDVALEVSTTEHGELVVLALSGEFDVYTVAEFRTEIERIGQVDRSVIVDLSGVTFLDSSGIGALVTLLNQARHDGGRVGVICPRATLRRVFEIAGLRNAFVFGDTLAAVRDGLSPGANPQQ